MSTTSEVDDYIRSLVKCARALPQKEWRWGQFTRPDGSPIETVEHVCEAQNDSANKSGGTELWGVDLGVDEPVVCYTGNGPRSKDHAQYIAAARPEILMWILAELGERIERLTQERDTASAAAARLSELERENARLRDVLERISQWKPKSAILESECELMQSIARAALEPRK